MEPFGDHEIRAQLFAQFGSGDSSTLPYRLLVENRQLSGSDDARLFCARSIQECDAIILILDGSSAMTRRPFDAPVLELEVMLAAVSMKPVCILDGSDGKDPLFDLLGSDFFAIESSNRKNIWNLRRDNVGSSIAHLKDVVGETCAGRGPIAVALQEHLGWSRLVMTRADRLDAFSEDGGNFPFAFRGLEVPDVMLSDISRLLDEGEQAFQTNKMATVVFGWDAIRALSKRPWGDASLERPVADLWLRALTQWSGAMSWLGLFGHSSGAAMMSNLARIRVADVCTTNLIAEGGPYSRARITGAVASSYFSLSRRLKDKQSRKIVLCKGLTYAAKSFAQSNDVRSKAEALTIHGTLSLATLTPIGLVRGLQELHSAVNHHKTASDGNVCDYGLAHARIQLGAAYKELGRRTLRASILLNLSRRPLESAYEVLWSEYDRGVAIDVGQLLMCMKHLIEVRLMLGQETVAFELWKRATNLATKVGVMDQYRQLVAIGNSQKWIVESELRTRDVT